MEETLWVLKMINERKAAQNVQLVNMLEQKLENKEGKLQDQAPSGRVRIMSSRPCRRRSRDLRSDQMARALSTTCGRELRRCRRPTRPCRWRTPASG